MCAMKERSPAARVRKRGKRRRIWGGENRPLSIGILYPLTTKDAGSRMGNTSGVKFRDMIEFTEPVSTSRRVR